METAKRLETLEFSKIRLISNKAAKMQEAGRKMHNFTLGQPDFPTPDYIKNACKKALEDGFTTYAPYEGALNFRQAICDKYERENGVHFDHDQVLSTCGAAHAAYLVISSFINPGDEVILPNPMYNIYEHITTICGGIKKKYSLKESNNFQIDLEEIKSLITDKTKMIILCSPSNPLGSVQTKETLDKLAKILDNKDILVVSDEIYERLVYDNTVATSPASIPSMKEKTIIINGFSKAFSMTGWRAGYVITHHPYRDKLVLHSGFQISGITSFVAQACATALNDEDKYQSIEKMRSEFEKRRNYMTGEINKCSHFSCLLPKGAFYIFMNIQKTGMSSTDFVDWLLEKYGVAVVSGSVFGSEGEGFVRISYATSMDEIQAGCEQLHKADEELPF